MFPSNRIPSSSRDGNPIRSSTNTPNPVGLNFVGEAGELPFGLFNFKDSLYYFL